ncbi:hypothetical protein [Dactylosporangium darangshiense]|uniref:Uncharacterized protein n=1 Tax=Dactylosporangium darangshiense TaxID=579108 RepID=A0ABP8D4S4_9ACTN
MTSLVGDELVLRPDGGRLLRLLLPLAVAAALIGYALVLGAEGARLVALIVIVAVVAAAPVIAGLIAALGHLTSAPARLDRNGVHLRRRRRLVTVPWDEIPLIWLDDAGRRLCVSPDPRGASADAWDPHGTRWTRRFRPLSAPVPRSVPPEHLRAAVATLSGGAVTLADRGPEAPPLDDDPVAALRVYRSGRTRPVWSMITTAASAVVLVPLIAGVAVPWNQPWWPGVSTVDRLPDACQVFAGEYGTALGATPREHTEDGRLSQECVYAVPQGDLKVTMEARHAVLGSSSADARSRAKDLASQMRGQGRRVDDVGEQAWLAGNPQGTTTLMDRAVVVLVAQRSNVVLVIQYGGERDPEAAQPAVLGAARSTLAALNVH